MQELHCPVSHDLVLPFGDYIQREGDSPKIDLNTDIFFERIAKQLVEEGIFDVDTAVQEKNDTLTHEGKRDQQCPVKIGHHPYGNLRFAADVVKADPSDFSIRAHRHHIQKLNRMVMAPSLFYPFAVAFAPFGQGETFLYEEVIKKIKMPTITYNWYRGFVPGDKENQYNDNAPRTEFPRRLFTREERIDAINLFANHPELYAPVVAYFGAVNGYLEGLKSIYEKHYEIAKEDLEREDRVASFEKHLSFDKFAKLWTSDNFFAELPIAISYKFHQRARQSNLSVENVLDSIDESFFADVFDFINKKDVFEENVVILDPTKSSHHDHVAKGTAHVLCPGRAILKVHLGDGALFNFFYKKIIEDKDVYYSNTKRVLGAIQDRARQALNTIEKTV